MREIFERAILFPRLTQLHAGLVFIVGVEISVLQQFLRRVEQFSERVNSARHIRET